MNLSPVTVVGNLTRDPEIFQFASGTSKTSFSVAVEHRYMKNGEWESATSFFNVVTWKYQADDAARVLQKGVRVIVVGRLVHRTWERDDGQSGSTIEITADEVAVCTRAIESFVRKTGASRSTVGAGTESPVSTPDAAQWTAPESDPWP